MKLISVLLAMFLGGCSFYPGFEEDEIAIEMSACSSLCASANEWARTCMYDDGPRPLLDLESCRSRLEDGDWPVDEEVCEFNLWCYARYRAYRFCEPLARTNVESGYWQPTLTTPELGCVDEWPDEWLAPDD